MLFEHKLNSFNSLEISPSASASLRLKSLPLPELHRTQFEKLRRSRHSCFVTLRLLFRSSPFHRPESSRGQSAGAAAAAPPALPGTRIHGPSTTSSLPAALPVPAAADSGGYILPSRGVVAAMSPSPKVAGEDTGATGSVRSAPTKNRPSRSRPSSPRCALICRVELIFADSMTREMPFRYRGPRTARPAGYWCHLARPGHSRESGNPLRKPLEMCCRRSGFPLSRE